MNVPTAPVAPGRARLLATLALALALAACGGTNCWRVGFERSGTSPEQGQADLLAAMESAAREVPVTPPAEGDAAALAAANAAMGRRIAAVHAAMAAKGYTEVKLPVDCETGAPK